MKPTVIGRPKRSPRAAVAQPRLAVGRQTGVLQPLGDVFGVRAVEDRRRDVHAEHRRGPAQVRLHDLPEVHARRHAQRVEHDVDRTAVFHIRHVFFGQHFGDDALVAVTSGHLVALQNLTLLRDVDADQMVDAGRELVAVFAREDLDVDDLALFAVRNFERGVAHFARLLAEDRAQQALLGRQLGLALGRDLADEDVFRDEPRRRCE